jgi:hypothetical protein
MKRIFPTIVKFITDHTSGVPFMIWSIGGMAVATFLFVFRDRELIQFDKIIYIIIVSIVWFVVSDIIKKKEVFNKRIYFIIDSIFYLFIFGSIIYLSGGFKSNLFFIFFLSAISIPFFTTSFGTFIFLFFVTILNYLIYHYMNGRTVNLYNTGIIILMGIFYFLVAGMVKFFQIEHFKKIEEIKKAEHTKSVLIKKLHKKIEELERFHRLTIGRELKMIELKKEIKKLKQELENRLNEKKSY